MPLKPTYFQLLPNKNGTLTSSLTVRTPENRPKLPKEKEGVLLFIYFSGKNNLLKLRGVAPEPSFPICFFPGL